MRKRPSERSARSGAPWRGQVSRFIAMACVLTGILRPAASGAAGGAVQVFGHVEGVVVAATTGRPVAGATVFLPDEAARTSSDREGRFVFPEPLPTDDPYRRIRAVVTAPGWGRWTIQGVPMYANDTLRLHVELRTQDWDHQVLTPAERRARSQPQAPESTYTYTCTGWNYQLVPTSTIKVYITADKTSEQYDFAFYAAHVLPNEWIASWDADALGAGAVAVKTYAGYRAMPGHAYSEGADCADVVDTVADQVFDPSWSNASTDQAVYATLGSVLYKNGGLFLSQYYAGAPDDPCAPVEGQFAGRMSQWGTQTCALESELWPDIVTTFYENTIWHYLDNLILDPDVNSAGTWAWTWVNGTATRTKGGSYNDNWHWEVVPSPGKQVSIREIRPFDGTETTTYHAEVALRCGTVNATDCTIIIWVVTFESDGTTHAAGKTVTVNNDGVWRLYTSDPAASGFDHYQVKLGIVSKQTIGVDGAVLTSAYGGP
jgi:Stage II sporulation protein/Carboxypeptidase regulatory-like domain